MAGIEELVQRYVASRNERDPVRHRVLIEELWTEDAVYVDPIVAARGRGAVADALANLRYDFPDLLFRLAAPLDTHHHVARFVWELAPADGPAVFAGLGVIVTEHGRVSRVYGFLDGPSPRSSTHD